MNETEKNLPAEETPATAETVVEATAETTIPDQQEGTETTSIHNKSCKELLADLQAIVESGNMQAHREVAALKAAFNNRRNREQLDELSAFVAEGNAPETFTTPVSAEEVPFRELLQKFKERRAAFLVDEERRMQKNLEKKQAIIAELRAIAEDIDNVNVNFQKFHQLQQDFREKADVPPTAETDLWKTYQTVVEEFYDRLKINKELRDLDFRKNLEAKKALIEQARALTEKEDVVEAARQLQTLHNAFREIGPVAKEIRSEIWEEFKTLSTAINKRHQDFFESRKASEQEAEQAKTALCEEAEAIHIIDLDTYAAWDEATKKVLDMQARWKQLGFASRKVNNALFNRFRATCDAFFQAKGAFYEQARANQSENLAKKIDLCERAEALANVENLKQAAETAAALQAEWKTIGRVGRRQSDEVWKRFSTACNAVFDRRHKFLSDRRHEETANLEAKRALIEKVKALPKDGDTKENLRIVKECQAEWTSIGHVPVKYKESLWQEFRTLCDEFYAADRGRESRNREARFKERAREIRQGGDKRVGSEKERLQRELDRKKGELKTYENNLGFFNVKSSAGNSMLKEMERRQARIQEEIAELQKRIKMLD